MSIRENPDIGDAKTGDLKGTDWCLSLKLFKSGV